MMYAVIGRCENGGPDRKTVTDDGPTREDVGRGGARGGPAEVVSAQSQQPTLVTFT